MIMINKEKTSAEKLDQGIFGIERDTKGAQIVLPGNKSADEEIRRVAAEKYNEALDEKSNEIERKVKEKESLLNNILDEKAGMELMPIYKHILCTPFEENPFQKIVTSDSGLIVDSGMAPLELNKDIGEMEERMNIMRVATVMSVGPEVTYVREGDIVYYLMNAEVPIPFFKQGFVMIHETNVKAVVNSGLTERFNQIKNM